MEKININLKTKAVIVRAEHRYNDRTWIILVSGIRPKWEGNGFQIDRHVSYNVEDNEPHISLKPAWWGDTKGYDFYYATEEDKQIIYNIIKKKGYKYIRTLNKLVDYKNGTDF